MSRKKWKKAIWRKRIRPISSKRQAQSIVYGNLRKDFLLANPWCAWGLKQNPIQHLRATQIHHTRGRAGRLYLAVEYWKGVSAIGHHWINENPNAARELGLLCPVGKWNHFE